MSTEMPLTASDLKALAEQSNAWPFEQAKAIVARLKKAGLSAEADLRNEKINYKVREHSLAKVPVMLVCGKREAEEQSVNVRRLGSRDQHAQSLDEAIAILVDEAMTPDRRRLLSAA